MMMKGYDREKAISFMLPKLVKSEFKPIASRSKELVEKYTVRVVTSDLEQQYIVLGNGALRVSAKEFRKEIENTTAEINETIERAKYRQPTKP